MNKIHSSTFIDPQAKLGNNCTINEHALISPNVTIADGVSIGSYVVINPFVVIGPNVTLADGVSIDPFVVIGPNVTIAENVKIGAGTKIGAFSPYGEQVKITIGKDTIIHQDVQINGITTIGENCKILGGAKIGGSPEDKSYNNEPTKVIIGNNNFIGENVTIHRGTMKDCGVTQIGNNTMITAGSYIAHDCQIGDFVTIVRASLAGHVKIGNYANLSGNSGVHQYTRIGEYAMIGAGVIVVEDILPYCIAGSDNSGRHGAVHHGLNKVGLERNGFLKEDVKTIYQAYKMVFESIKTPEGLPKKLSEEFPNNRFVENMAAFIEKSLESERGLAPSKQQNRYFSTTEPTSFCR